MAVSISINYICTRALHSFLSSVHHWASSTVIPLLSKITLIQSIQPNLGLTRTRAPLTSAVETLLAMRSSSILSTYPNHLNTVPICVNHLNTLWSTLPPTLFLFEPFYEPLRPNSIHSCHSYHTSKTFHLKNTHSPSLCTSHTPCLCPIQCRWQNYTFIQTLFCI